MLIKKVFIFIIILSVSLFDVCAAEPTVSARSAVVMDVSSGELLFAKNEDEVLSMASTTKIMTSLIAIESGKLDCYVTAPSDILCDGTAIGIKKGDCFTLEALVWAMMLESGNDAAQLTAVYLAGSEEAFSVLMNDKAEEIGMKNTNFVTASGLDSEKHYTTAYDMALLAGYAVKNPIFRNMCSAQSKKVEYINPEISVTYSNHNKLLKMYDGVFGIKTGFTKKSGRCLVSACEKDSVTLVAVTLNAPDDWNDHIKLYNYSFAAVSAEDLTVDGIPPEISVYGCKDKGLSVKAEEVKINNCNNLKYEIYIPEFIYAPVKCGDIVGSIRVYSDGRLICEQSVYSCENIGVSDVDNKPCYGFSYKFRYLINKLLKG